MNAHDFCASWVADNSKNGSRVLDYGCGFGEIVAKLRESNVDAYGCDVFYEGGTFSKLIPAAEPYISRMTGDAIPFDDASLDIVISNGVIEHVQDLDSVVAEIARVLKPGGVSMHVFPDISVWMEGHAVIPFLHRFGKGTNFRTYYARAMAKLPGFGLPLNGMTSKERWSKKCVWLDDWTHYRSLDEIHSIFGKYFNIQHIEDRRFDAKFGHVNIPASAKRWLMRHLAGDVVELHKR